MIIRKILTTHILSLSLSTVAGYDVDYLKSLVPSAQKNIENLKTALRLSWDGYLVGAISQAASMAGYEKVELEAVYRFKNVKKTTDADLNKWVSQQSDSSVKTMFEFVDQFADKKSLILAQNEKCTQNDGLCTIEQAFERMIQNEHFLKKHSKNTQA